MAEKKIGVVTHYFAKIGVAAVRITDGVLRIGDTIHIKGHTTDVSQSVDSMEMEHESVEAARAGDEVGLKTTDYVRDHDALYKVTPD